MDEVTNIIHLSNRIISAYLFIKEPYFFCFLLPILIAISPFWEDYDCLKTKKIQDARIKLRISILTLFWIVISALGIIYKGQGDPASSITLFIVIAYFIYGFYQIYANKEFRKITTIFFLINGYFVLISSLYASMSITDAWL